MAGKKKDKEAPAVPAAKERVSSNGRALGATQQKILDLTKIGVTYTATEVQTSGSEMSYPAVSGALKRLTELGFFKSRQRDGGVRAPYEYTRIA